MKKLIVFATVLAVSVGCFAPKTKVVSTSSVQDQQARAAAAQAEMQRDIDAGTPILTEPNLNRTPKSEPSAVLPPKNKVSKLGSFGPQTKYPIQNGFPVWFFTPVYDGYIGSIGIAPKQSSITAQKRVARMQAQKNLAKQINVLVTSDVRLEATNVDTATVKYYREKLTSLTKEQVDQFLTGFKVMDEWINPDTGEYYMWMVLKR